MVAKHRVRHVKRVRRTRKQTKQVRRGRKTYTRHNRRIGGAETINLEQAKKDMIELLNMKPIIEQEPDPAHRAYRLQVLAEQIENLQHRIATLERYQ